VAIKVYLSVMQIGFISQQKTQKPILMTEGDYVKAANYAIEKERLHIGESIVELFLIFMWIGVGFNTLSSFLEGGEGVLFGVLFILSFLGLNYIFSLPFSYYGSMVLDKRYGFNKQTKKEFVLDLIKGIAIGALFISLLSAAIIYFMDSTENWWIYGFLITFVLIVVINMIYPTIIAPIFNKFTPLEKEELKESIDQLLLKCGFKSSGVFIMDAGKRDSRLNAYFGGLGKTKRVVLFDTLLEKLENREILAVLGHELGHFKHMDIYKNIFLSGTIMFFVFALYGLLPDSFFSTLNISESSASKIALFILLLNPITFFITPLVAFFSRKAEYKADNYGVSLSSKEELGNALLKLVRENSSFPLSHPFYIFFYYTHPPVIERFKAMGFNYYDDK